MNAMLLCAGLGTRFLPVTEKVSKPAIPFLNIPLLGYSLFELERMKPKNLVVNTHHLPKTVELAARGLIGAKPKYNLLFSHEPTILGSGGGIRAAETYLSGDEFIVANGDEVNVFSHDAGYAPLVEFHRKSKALATLLTTVHPEAGKTMGGVWTKSDGAITKLGEMTGEKDAQHFAGVFVFSPQIFKFMPKSGPFHIFRECLVPAIQAGERIMAYQDREMIWLDTTDVKSFVASTGRALRELEGAVYARPLLAVQERYGHKMNRVSARQWLAPGARFGGNAASSEGGENARVTPYLFMGENSDIRAGVEIQNFAVIGAGAKFSQGVIDSSIVGPDVRINELVGLRRQVVIG